MSKKYFYSHIVATEDISLAIGGLDMPKEDRVKLIELAEQNIHHEILDSMLDELPEKEKKNLLLHISQENHEEVWSILKKHVSNAEEKITKIARQMKKEMHEDIKNVSK